MQAIDDIIDPNHLNFIKLKDNSKISNLDCTNKNGEDNQD